MKMTVAPHQPGPDRSHPTVKMPPRAGVELFRREIPELAQPFEALFTSVSCNEGRSDSARRRTRQPMQRDAPFRKCLVGPGVIGRKAKPPCKNHRGSWSGFGHD